MKMDDRKNGKDKQRKEILVRIPAYMLDDLDEWIRSQPVPPSRNAVVLAAITRWIEENPIP